jgi:hypothetical protein
MQPSNTTWTIAGATEPAKLILQNVGNTRIGFVIQAAAPGDDDIDLVNGGCGILFPGNAPTTFTGLDTEGKSVYVRTLSAGPGALFVA